MRAPGYLQLNVLQEIFRGFVQLPQQHHNLFVEDWVELGEGIRVYELVEWATVFSPVGTIRHQTETPIHLHAELKFGLSFNNTTRL